LLVDRSLRIGEERLRLCDGTLSLRGQIEALQLARGDEIE
jgi:hypothetical protein